jgi:hypothetical protein
VLKSLGICCGCCKEYGLGKAQSINFPPMGILHNVTWRKVLKDMCKIPNEDESTHNDLVHMHSALGKALGENL